MTITTKTTGGMPEDSLLYKLARVIGPRIPACMRKIPDLFDDYADDGETKLRVPFHTQTDWYSCGPIAAWMVVKTFHPKARFAAFYQDCNAHPTQGTGERQLVRALRKHRVGVAIRRNLDFEAIAKAIEDGFPIIAGTGHEYPDGDHWVVIYGVRRKPRTLFICNMAGPEHVGHSRAAFTWREWKSCWNPKGEGLVCWGKGG